MDAPVLVLLDLDNTIYDFAAFFSPAFRGMISALSKATGIERDTLIEESALIYDKYGSLEYAFVVERLPCMAHLAPADRKKAIRWAAGAFRRVRKKRLELYPTVRETLKVLRDGGCIVCAVTNAPAFQAYRRLQQLHVLNYFHSIYAGENFDLSWLSDEERPAFSWDRTKIHIEEISSDAHKPNPALFARLIETFGADPKTTFMVGDSAVRDLVPARECGIITVFAKYGCKLNTRDEQWLTKLTPANIAGKSAALVGFNPDFEIDEFGELLNILPMPSQLRLF